MATDGQFHSNRLAWTSLAPPLSACATGVRETALEPAAAAPPPGMMATVATAAAANSTDRVRNVRMVPPGGLGQLGSALSQGSGECPAPAPNTRRRLGKRRVSGP